MNFGENQSYTQYLQEKWSPVLEHQNLSPIKSNYKKAVLAQLMENTATASEISNMNVLTESAPTNSIGAGTAISNYDPILISLIRRALPNMMPFDLMGVQPMTGPTGIIFAMRSRYINQKHSTMKLTQYSLVQKVNFRMILAILWQTAILQQLLALCLITLLLYWMMINLVVQCQHQ